MQNIEVWVINDVSVLQGNSSCQNPTYSSICNKITSAYQSAQTNVNLVDAFALPGRSQEISPVVEYFKLKHFPALVFYDPDGGLGFYAIDGNKITEKRIKKAFEMAENYTWDNATGGYINADGDNANTTDDMETKIGGLMGGDWGLPLGGMWGDCKSYLPDSMDKVCDIPVWLYALILLLILILLIKIVS